ncbi:hypothetical protein ACFC60_16960 [Kitasatospora purpeofusca]|uniref:hypothetical protein n=1 Tax=Kitasatospora purpeofusca TaxID=67352 RepID=UPI0035D9C2F9
MLRPGHGRASDDHGRAVEEDRRVTDTRQPDSVGRTYSYESATAVVVVNGNDRPDSSGRTAS